MVKFCSKCGIENQESASFCSSCGNNLQQQKVEPSLVNAETVPFWKKTITSIGKSLVKGVKTIAESSARTIQVRNWKDQLLRRMNTSYLIALCREKNIATITTKSELKENKRTGEMYWKESQYKYSYDELVSRINNRVGLEEIISFAKRNHINVRDILGEIDKKKAEWHIKEITEKINESEMVNFTLELEKAIHEFQPLRRYYEEILYQDSLATWLRSKFPDTEVEIGRGSTRPDIIVNDIAIEVKGPTNDAGLQTIADKCMRYHQYFPKGLICVLFDVQVYPQRYEDWLRGMKKTFANVIVIKK